MNMSPKPAMHAPTSTSGGSKPTKFRGSGEASASVSLALDLGWQLLLVVLVPIVGGHLLDGKFHTSPLYTVLGVAVTSLGMLAVIIRTIKTMNKDIALQTPDTHQEGKK